MHLSSYLTTGLRKENNDSKDTEQKKVSRLDSTQ